MNDGIMHFPLKLQQLLNRIIPTMDDWGHEYIPAWWSKSAIGQFVCDQADYIYTGMDDTRRF